MFPTAHRDDPPRPAPWRVVSLAPGPIRRAPMLTAAAAAVATVVLVPLVYLVIRAFERGPDVAVDHVLRGRTADLLLRTALLAGTVTAACLVLGVGAAWLVVRSDLPWRGPMGVLFTLPLAIPSFVAGSTWVSTWPGLAGFPGAFLVLTLGIYPYVMLPVIAALRRSDPATEEVARSLGKGPVRTFFLVTMRAVRPTALAGGLLVMLYVLGDFGAVSLMRYESFTMGIYVSYRAGFDRTPAAVLGCVLVVLAAVIMLAERRAQGAAAKYGQVRVGSGVSRSAPVVPLGKARWPAFGASVLLLTAAVGVPAASVTRWLSGSSRTVDLPRLASATWHTMSFSALGALLAVVLALPVALLAARHTGRLSKTIESVSYIGYALPGLTIGLALVFVGIRLVPSWYQEPPMLVIAYGVLFLPLAIAAVRTGVDAAPRRLEEVSRSLGKGAASTHMRVTLPLAAPGFAAGVALVFLTAAKELPATLLLRPTGTSTLATEMWTLTDQVMYGAAAPYAVTLMAIAAVPSLILGRVLVDRPIRSGGSRWQI